MKPVIVITIENGTVAEARASIPLTVIVEEWPNVPNEPLIFQPVSEPLQDLPIVRVAAVVDEANGRGGRLQ